MGALVGLKAMDAALGDRDEQFDGVKTRWLGLEDKQSVIARFANELDEDSPNYDPRMGAAVVHSEHVSPLDYTRKAVCTMEEEGRCFACEQARKQSKEDAKENGSWRKKYRYYTNVLVNDGVEDPYIAVWSQGVGKQSQFPYLREYSMDTGSITNREWKMTRKGKGTATNYTLLPRDPDTEKFDWSDYEPFDLMKVVREVPYADQEAFFMGFDSPSKETTNLEW